MSLMFFGTIAAVVAGIAAVCAAGLLHLASERHRAANDVAHQGLATAIGGVRADVGSLKDDVASKADADDVATLRTEMRDGFEAIGNQIATLGGVIMSTTPATANEATTLSPGLEKAESMAHNIGTKPGKGRYCCTNCNWAVTLDDDSDSLPPCGNCGKGQNTTYVSC